VAPEARVVREAAKASVLRCDGCGAAVAYDVEVQAPKCAFCGSVAHIEHPEDPIEVADGFLAFRVDEASARRALVAWHESLGWWRPSDLSGAAVVDAMQPLYWVGWIFNADATVSWTADSDYGSRRSAWAPHSGQSSVGMRCVLVSASRGLTEQETSQLAPAYDLGTTGPEPAGPDGVVIERFDVQRSAARATISRAVEGYARVRATQWIPGTRHRNLHVAVLLSRLETRRSAFPAYVLAYRYRNKAYRAVVHGQNAAVVIGTAPYSFAKIALVIVGSILAIAIAVAMILSAGG
jgi:hypothetical protein